MKWPKSITLIRHGQSQYNALRGFKDNDPTYRAFRAAFQADPQSEETKRLANLLRGRYALPMGDYETPLTPEGMAQARLTGEALSRVVPLPDVIFCSPYLRTGQTLIAMKEKWEDLKTALVVPDDRIREQEHGLSLLYSDWRLFNVFHPEQKALRDLMGPYWYQYPQGESVSQVRDRIRLVTTTLIREWAGKDVWLVTHHLTILSIRANLERLSPEQFIHLDEREKPVNCGVTRYECNPERGKDGKMELVWYNKRFY